MTDVIKTSERSTHEAAYILARAYQHKAWARRWLKANGYWS